MNRNFIFEYWQKQAQVHRQHHSASWGDSRMIQLEIEEIAQRLPQTGSVLDAGCANGYSTQQILGKVPGLQLTGVDFAPAMISEALQREQESCSGTTYQVGDIRELPFESGSFDAAYTTRTIINLSTWEEQVQALKEMVRVVRPGGQVLISEAFWEPLCALNTLRALGGLNPLEEHDFNRYLKLHRVESFLKEVGLEFNVISFSSVYYLGSRFLREILTEAGDYPGYTNPVNEAFFEIEQQWSGGPFSVQTLVEIMR